MKYIVNLIRILVGALFIFSGFVKAVDPLGTAYKMHEYFASFGTLGLKGFWEQMNALSTPISVTMIVVEMAAGFALLTGWAPKFTAWILFAMTMFFTVLTGFTYLSGFCPSATFAAFSMVLTVMVILSAATWNTKKRLLISGLTFVGIIIYLVLIKYTSILFTCDFTESKMKVTDCGCFGDFMKLKPWQTFSKDLVLDVLIFILVAGVKFIKPIFKPALNNKAVFGATVISVLFCLSNYMWGLPIIDFRPYKIGNNIRDLRQMQKPEVRDFFFIYKNTKTGEQRGFKMDELDKMNSDEWEFVDRKDSIIDPGIPAKIDGFYIMDENGADITDSLLADKNYSLMVVAYHLKETDVTAFVEKLNPLAAACDKAGVRFYAVAGGDMVADQFRHEHQCAFPFYTADETPLKTIIRSNPGLVLLKDGVVINM